MSPRRTASNYSEIKKRNGALVAFDIKKIDTAIFKALTATGEGDEQDAQQVANTVVKELNALKYEKPDYTPTVEDVQDIVERRLMVEGFAETAKAYIIYRQKRAELRTEEDLITDDVRARFKENGTYFSNKLAEMVYFIAYSRWRSEWNRRETWAETIQRFMDFMHENVGGKLSKKEYDEVQNAMLYHNIQPSMRLLWSSGDAARESHVTAYNCSFIAPTQLEDFGEIMYICMCGTGVGFSAESHVVQQLPQIQKQTGKMLKTHVVKDSKQGWADAFVLALKAWFNGKDIQFDYSEVRPAGARLKTMGGRASGPEPLIELMDFARKKVFARQGRRLSNIDVHDIICKIGEIVIAGGVRRSALISLSDLDDEEMRHAKMGQFWNTEPQRSMANNSAVYEGKPSSTEFLDEWIALMKSGSGERGIFNRGGLQRQLPERRWKVFEEHATMSGTNPCGEIILRSKQFCNLTAVVVKPEDKLEDLLEKIRLATILGTYQASLTNFKYLSDEWRKNCEEEALLGVSMTGYWDNSLVRDPKVLRKLRDYAVEVNKKYAKKIGINPSTCVTCIKPSGNTSQISNTASGMHPRYAPYYIRRVRISASDPLFGMLRDQGMPHHPEVGQQYETARTYVLEFPVKSPDKAIYKDDVSAIEMLEQWKLLKENYTEHNPSVTIYVGPDEWIGVADWVYKNWDMVGGISFLPRTDHVYQLAPYEEITEEQYQDLAKKIEHIDFSKLPLYEREDKTSGAKELACVGGACEI